MFFKNVRFWAVALLSLFFINGAIAQNNKSITVINDTKNTVIWFVHFSSIDLKNWGPDQLKGNVINPGGSMTWTIPWNGCWIDIKAKSFLGEPAIGKVNVCGGGIWTLYDEK